MPAGSDGRRAVPCRGRGIGLVGPGVGGTDLAHGRPGGNAHEHRLGRQVDPVGRRHGETRVDAPQERERPIVEIRQPVAHAEDRLIAPQLHRPLEARRRDRSKPARLDPGPLLARPGRRASTAPTRAPPCTGAARHRTRPGPRSGRSRPSRPTTSRRNWPRTARVAASVRGFDQRRLRSAALSTSSSTCPPSSGSTDDPKRRVLQDQRRDAIDAPAIDDPCASREDDLHSRGANRSRPVPRGRRRR